MENLPLTGLFPLREELDDFFGNTFQKNLSELDGIYRNFFGEHPSCPVYKLGLNVFPFLRDNEDGENFKTPECNAIIPLSLGLELLVGSEKGLISPMESDRDYRSRIILEVIERGIPWCFPIGFLQYQEAFLLNFGACNLHELNSSWPELKMNVDDIAYTRRPSIFVFRRREDVAADGFAVVPMTCSALEYMKTRVGVH